ncbi:MAG: hybrid sensor histidine kinase/response regulator, partial [Marivivens sp.]|nr:hybrid sensor histidine kinase/response regulator [Marivivens sp.]
MTAQGNKHQPLRWARFGILGVVLLVCFGAIAILGFEVNRKIKEQATASSDNVQWVLSQLEVEYLSFDAAITEAQLDGDIRDVRRRFDILYSRVATFRTGQAYETL